MRYFTVLFFVLTISCSVMNKEKFVTLSTLDEQKFLLTKEDSLIINEENIKLKKFSDSCEKNKLTCFIDPFQSEAQFYGGAFKFREVFYKNLNIPKISKPSKNKIRIIIGKNDNIESIEVANFKDEAIKNEILRVLSLPEMNKWKSAKLNNRKNVEFEIIFYLYIKQNQ